jgi:hypothetical protein
MMMLLSPTKCRDFSINVMICYRNLCFIYNCVTNSLFPKRTTKNTDGGIVYKQILINAKLQIGKSLKNTAD